MAIEERNIMRRFSLVVGFMFVFGVMIVVKLINLQFVHGEKYRDLAREATVKTFTIPANRGNIYGDDGSLLATSVPKYDIWFDTQTVDEADFQENLIPLSEGLSKMFGRPATYYQSRLRKAHADRHRYFPIAKNLGYSEYVQINSLPLFNKGQYRGGIITKTRTVREHPIGKIAERTVGTEVFDNPGYYAAGIEGAFHEDLKGKDGQRVKQKIGSNQWKPVDDATEIEPLDGYDVVTTINVNIQDIAHHALLRQLEKYEADHGVVIVMEVATGEVKAISNLGRTKQGTYAELLNYGVGEAHEPGSTFKLMSFMAALEDKVIDTSTVIDTGPGSKIFYRRTIYDTRGYGKISAARIMEVSSNIGMATILDRNYSKNPERFLNYLKAWHLNKETGVPIKGEGSPVIPEPGSSLWSKNALPSMAYGYNLKLTPLQTLVFYNAVANNGVMVKPKFVKEIRSSNKVIKAFETEIINPKIASEETIRQTQEILKNIVRRGTGRSLYSPDFSMAGKTGTAQTEYWMPDWKSNRRYISSFAGYFPAENPKYSCIVVIHKPSTRIGFYGGDVSGPVFKRVAQKIFTDSTILEEENEMEFGDPTLENEFETYYAKLQNSEKVVPNVSGMPAMDAIALLENLGLKVQAIGTGKVSKQSLQSGANFKRGQQITINLL